MAKAKPRIGESAFTHQDDASAPIHTTNAAHTEAHVYGGVPEEDRETVVIGPPAFGSPDVRTLGHSVNPDQNAVSAPKLDPHFEAIVDARGVYTEDDLNEMSKDELYEFASNAGVDVHKSMTKSEMIDAIAEEHDLAESDEAEEEAASGDPNNPDNPKSTKTEATRTETSARSQASGTKSN